MSIVSVNSTIGFYFAFTILLTSTMLSCMSTNTLVMMASLLRIVSSQSVSAPASQSQPLPSSAPIASPTPVINTKVTISYCNQHNLGPTRARSPSRRRMSRNHYRLVSPHLYRPILALYSQIPRSPVIQNVTVWNPARCYLSVYVPDLTALYALHAGAYMLLCKSPDCTIYDFMDDRKLSSAQWVQGGLNQSENRTCAVDYNAISAKGLAGKCFFI